MKKFKKHENEIAKLTESNNRLSREVEHQTQMLAAEKDCKQWAYEKLLEVSNQLRMAESKASHYKFSNGLLEKEIEQLKGGSIYTVSKRETELERQLKSECMRADELFERNETLQNRYDEAEQAVKELTDKNKAMSKDIENQSRKILQQMNEITQLKAEKEQLEAENAAMLLGAEEAENDE